MPSIVRRDGRDVGANAGARISAALASGFHVSPSLAPGSPRLLTSGVILSRSVFGGGQTNLLPSDPSLTTVGENPVLGRVRTLELLGGHKLSDLLLLGIGDSDGGGVILLLTLGGHISSVGLLLGNGDADGGGVILKIYEERFDTPSLREQNRD